MEECFVCYWFCIAVSTRDVEKQRTVRTWYFVVLCLLRVRAFRGVEGWVCCLQGGVVMRCCLADVSRFAVARVFIFATQDRASCACACRKCVGRMQDMLLPAECLLAQHSTAVADSRFAREFVLRSMLHEPFAGVILFAAFWPY